MESSSRHAWIWSLSDVCFSRIPFSSPSKRASRFQFRQPVERGADGPHCIEPLPLGGNILELRLDKAQFAFQRVPFLADALDLFLKVR
jgi:hypothetical protein